MPLTAAEALALATNEASRITHLSLHTADPGGTGASEATGGTPAYARQPAGTWTYAGQTATSAQVTFDVAAGTYTHFGTWSALTAGTFRGGNALSASQTFSAQGQIKLTVTIPVTAS